MQFIYLVLILKDRQKYNSLSPKALIFQGLAFLFLLLVRCLLFNWYLEPLNLLFFKHLIDFTHNYLTKVQPHIMVYLNSIQFQLDLYNSLALHNYLRTYFSKFKKDQLLNFPVIVTSSLDLIFMFQSVFLGAERVDF